MPLLDLKVWIWCAVSAQRTIQPMPFHGTVSTECYVRSIWHHSLANWLTKMSYGHFMQSIAKAHNCKQFCGCSRCSHWRTSYKWMFATSVITQFKSLRLLFVEQAEIKSVYEWFALVSIISSNFFNVISAVLVQPLQQVPSCIFSLCDACLGGIITLRLYFSNELSWTAVEKHTMNNWLPWQGCVRSMSCQMWDPV